MFSSSVKYTSLQKKEKIIYSKILWKQQNKTNSYVLLLDKKQKLFVFVDNDLYDELNIGDYVLTKVVLKNISFRNNYEFYLYSSFDVTQYGFIEEVLKINRNKTVAYKIINKVFFVVNKLREKLVELTKLNIAQPYNDVILRLTIGYKNTELNEIYKYFQDAGVAHVLVVSGLHVGFVYTFLYFGLKFLVFDRGLRIIFSSFFTVFFMLLTGCSPPVVRATIIVLSFSISELLSRKQNSVRSLIFAAFVVLLINPSNLFSVSFQLSFFACFGIIYFYPMVYSYLKTFVEKLHPLLNYIIKLFLMTTSAQVATIPLIGYYFNKFSIISFLSNIFVIPITSVLLWFSILGYITSFLTKINFIMWKIIEFLTFVYINIVKFFSQIPYCVINIAKPDLLNIFVYYFVIVLLVPVLLNRNKFKTSVFVTILAISLMFTNFEFNKNLKITFLDVGLGDSILIKTEDNKTILVDTADSEQTAMYKISPWLKENGVFAIDYLLITHPHYPHYGGSEFLIDNFKVKNVCINELVPPEDFEYKDLIEKLKQKNIKLCFIDKTKTLKFLETDIKFIPNYENYLYDKESFYDNNSVFVKIKYKDVNIVLTNDIPTKYLNNVVENCILFLQVPRHGKYKEDIVELKKLKCKPKFLVVSTDKYVSEIKKLNIPVFTTVDDGNITINIKTLRLRKIKKSIQGVDLEI